MKARLLLFVALLFLFPVESIFATAHQTQDTWQFKQVTDGESHHEFPALNGHGRIVWVESINGFSHIVSNKHGQITSGDTNRLHPSINDRGEIVYQELVNGYWQIVSTKRGYMTTGPTNHTDPYISDSKEVVWIENGQVHSNVRGQLTFSGSHITPAVNAAGEFVWGTSDERGNRNIFSSTRGLISNDGLSPSINDAGEIVWFQEVFDPEINARPYQIFSSVQGQITHVKTTEFLDQVFYPYINSRGNIVYQQGVGSFFQIFKGMKRK